MYNTCRSSCTVTCAVWADASARSSERKACLAETCPALQTSSHAITMRMVKRQQQLTWECERLPELSTSFLTSENWNGQPMVSRATSNGAVSLCCFFCCNKRAAALSIWPGRVGVPFAKGASTQACEIVLLGCRRAFCEYSKNSHISTSFCDSEL